MIIDRVDEMFLLKLLEFLLHSDTVLKIESLYR